jgi:hypothetical protein
MRVVKDSQFTVVRRVSQNYSGAMKYVLMLGLSVLAAGGMVWVVFYCNRRLRKIEEDLWGPRKKKIKEPAK